MHCRTRIIYLPYKLNSCYKKKYLLQQLKNVLKKRFENISLCDSLNSCKANTIITYQLVKSATSVGANYRAACVARSRAEFYSKICIVAEEIDETIYWLELIKEGGLSNDIQKLNDVLKESKELSKIIIKAKFSTYRNNSPKSI